MHRDKGSDRNWNSFIDIDSFHNCTVYSNCIDGKGSDRNWNNHIDIEGINNCTVYSNCIDGKGSDSV